MANYSAMTTYELEQKYSSLMDKIMECETDEELDALNEEIYQIEDELDLRDQIEESEEWED